MVQHIIMSYKDSSDSDSDSEQRGGAPKKKVPFINQISLGDILKIDSPNQVDFHERTFLVIYVDSDLIRMIDTENAIVHQIKVHNGRLVDVNIRKFIVVSTSEEKGYARQNGLVQHVWVDIAFGGEIPKTYTAQITNAEEDMIELTTYPENSVFYIDFAYRGIPLHLPILSICVRDKPESIDYTRTEERGQYDQYDQDQDEDEDKQDEDEDEYDSQQASVEYSDSGTVQIRLPANIIPDASYRDQLQKIYTSNDEVVFGQ